jgi:hypothetical protein
MHYMYSRMYAVYAKLNVCGVCTVEHRQCMYSSTYATYNPAHIQLKVLMIRWVWCWKWFEGRTGLVEINWDFIQMTGKYLLSTDATADTSRAVYWQEKRKSKRNSQAGFRLLRTSDDTSAANVGQKITGLPQVHWRVKTKPVTEFNSIHWRIL